MSVKPAERLLQIVLGLVVFLASGLYLWRDTILPILNSKGSLGGVADSVRLGARYLSWKERAEEVRAKALEADRESRLRGKADSSETPQKAGPEGSR